MSDGIREGLVEVLRARASLPDEDVVLQVLAVSSGMHAVGEKTLPPLGVTDGRSERWKAAEARCSHAHCDPADLAIVEEEQALHDAEHPQ